MLKKIYAVVGSPISDIGKGWVTACICNLVPKALPFKIDIDLACIDFSDIDMKNDHTKVSSDFKSYEKLNLPILTSNQLIHSGCILYDYLLDTRVDWKCHEVGARHTFSKVADYLAGYIKKTIGQCDKDYQFDCENLVIEVGGNVADAELTYIPLALKKLSCIEHCELKLILVSYVEYSEEPKFPIKQQLIMQGIEKTRLIYGEPSLVFFRKRLLPFELSEKEINYIKKAISSRICFEEENLVYLPNVLSVYEELKYIAKNNKVLEIIKK